MPQSLNFQQYQAEANEFLYDVMYELGIDNRDQAGRILRAILQAIRDRLPVNDAANFAQQLPLIWKGVYYSEFEPDKMPVKIRDVQEFINFVRSKDVFALPLDFPTDTHVVTAFNCVLTALHNRMSEGTLEKMVNQLPHEIHALITVPHLKLHVAHFKEVAMHGV